MNGTDWTIGTLDKNVIWSLYITFNGLGVFFCSFLLLSIIKRANRPANDVVIGGLLSGCIWMSVTCGGQCFISVLHGYFFGGRLACALEAFFHVSAILVQFFHVAAFGVINAYSVRRARPITVPTANWIVLSIWIVCISVTLALSLISPIYLVSNGTYCFFEFKSPAILFWLVVGLVGAVLVLIVAFAVIIWTAVRNPLSRLNAATLSCRASVYVGVLIVGWGAAAVAAIYEYTRGTALEWIVTWVGTGGTFHTIMVAFVYLLTAREHRRVFYSFFCRCRLFDESGHWAGNTATRAEQTPPTDQDKVFPVKITALSQLTKPAGSPMSSPRSSPKIHPNPSPISQMARTRSPVRYKDPMPFPNDRMSPASPRPFQMGQMGPLLQVPQISLPPSPAPDG